MMGSVTWLRIFGLLAFLALLPASANTFLPLSEHKRVEAAICPDAMNRIAVANDRIVQIFGDEGAFESQNDDQTGQVFLKPTPENGAKDLSVTLITEQGVTQDLTLKPTAGAPATLVFKNEKASPASPQPSGHVPSPAAFRQLPCEQVAAPHSALLAALVRVVRGQAAPLEEGFFGNPPPSRQGSEGGEASFQQAFLGGPYEVWVFQVKNTLDTLVEVDAPSFYQPGDLALCLQKQARETLLYVVRAPKIAHTPEGTPHG